MRLFELFESIFESLETRQFLSATHSHSPKIPAAQAYLIADIAQPMGSSTPYSSSYTPSQIRKAYGFDQINLPGITADGSGQTIAIVDAYDNPNVVSDLHNFDLQFGL